MKRTLPIFTLLTLTACATLTGGSEQLIEVTTNPPGANCVLSNSEGSWTIETTPGSAMVERAFEPLSVDCARVDVGSASTILEAKTRGRAYGNILLLGIPALIDAKTGDGYEYDPASVVLNLH